MSIDFPSLARIIATLTVVTGLAVAQSAPAAEPAPKKVAILLFNDVEIIDYTGPWEVFGADGFEVFTVSASTAPITTSMGMKVVPNFSYANAPQADVVLIPGGGVHDVQGDPATLDWIRQQSAHAEHVMSVCNGSFTLASTGLLKGLKSTSTSGNIDLMRKRYPEVDVVRDQRVVDNGKFLSTGGLSAGIDGALHLVSVMRGHGEAQYVAQLLEYNWQPDGGFLPADNAFHALPMMMDHNVAGFATIDSVVSTSGDKLTWKSVYTVSSALSDSELRERLVKGYAIPQDAMIADADPRNSSWKFVDADGLAWKATLSVSSVSGSAGLHLVAIGVARSG
jgi:putative intracellular protease/amidase